MSKKRTQKSTKFYLNSGSRAEGHKLSGASKEELLAICKLVKNDEDNTLFIFNGNRGLKRLKSLISKAAANSQADTSKVSIIKKYFAQFDLGSSKKFKEWREKNPDYNPEEWNWDLTFSDDSKQEVDTEPDLLPHDPAHYDDPQFNQTVDSEFGRTTNDNSDSLSTNHNHNQNQQSSNIDPQQSDNNVHSENFQKFKDIVQDVGVIFQSLIDQSDDTTIQQTRQQIMNELFKSAITLGVTQHDNFYDTFSIFYSDPSANDVETLYFTAENDTERYLIDKGYLSASGDLLKVYKPRINRQLGVDLINNNHNSTSSSEPPRKRQRVSLNRGLQGHRPPSTTSVQSQIQPPQSQQQIPQSVLNVIQNDLNIQDANQFVSILQKPQVRNYIQQLHNPPPQLPQVPRNPTQHYSQSVPPFQSLIAPSGHIQQGVVQSEQQLLNQIAALSDAVKVLQQNARREVPRPELQSNPYRQHMDISVQSPFRGLRNFVQDYQKCNAIVTRINDVVCGEEMDPDLKKLMKKLNSSKNKEIVSELEGPYLTSISLC